MNVWQIWVREFHEALKQPAPDRIALDSVRLELRARLIMEEAIETCEALGFELVGNRASFAESSSTMRLKRVAEPDWPEVIDGLCDLIYVSLGCAVEMGINLAPFFWEVHKTNLMKTGGPKDPITGKVLKPRDWKPPSIEKMLNQLIKNG